jgi:hypothetical protein
MPLPVPSPKLLNFIIFLLFLNLFTGSKLMKEFNSKFSLSYETLHSGHPSYSILSLKRKCSTCSSSLVTLNRPCNHSRLKITNRSLYLTDPDLWNSLPPDLCHFSSRFTSSQPKLNSPLFSLSVFLKKLKTHLLTFLFLLSLTA